MKKNDDYYFIFKGARLNKLQAKKTGVGVLFGIIGILFTFFLPFGRDNIFNYIVISIVAFIGYFIVAPKIFK